MKKIENQNKFLITSIFCIMLLMFICYYGINNFAKGTRAADYAWCVGHAIDFNGVSYCCPDDTYSIGYDVVGLTKDKKISDTSSTFTKDVLKNIKDYVYCVKTSNSTNTSLKNDHQIRLQVGQEKHKIQDPEYANSKIWPYYLGVQGIANDKKNTYSKIDMNNYCNQMNGAGWSANEYNWLTVSNNKLVKYTGSGELYYACKADSITRVTDSKYGISAITIKKAGYRNNNYNPFYSHAYDCSSGITALDWVKFAAELKTNNIDIKTQDGINKAAEIAKNHAYCIYAHDPYEGDVLYKYKTDPGEAVVDGRKLGEMDKTGIFPSFGPQGYYYSSSTYNNIRLITLYQNGKAVVVAGVNDFCKALNGNNWSNNVAAWQYQRNGTVYTCKNSPCTHTDGTSVKTAELVYNCKRNNLAADNSTYNAYGYSKPLAIQEKQQTITTKYTANYYTDSTSTPFFTSSCTSTNGAACTISSIPTPNKTGYTFRGWGNTKNCTSGKIYTSESITGNITKYACWEVKQNTYRATFNINGGVLNGAVQKSCTTTGTSCEITNLPTATREGYIFNGWGTSSTCTQGNTTKLSLSKQETVYYACWEIKKNTYKATFNANNGSISGVTEKSCSTAGTSCDISGLPTATRDGYIFKGWSTNSKCTQGTTSIITLSKNNTTYYACWEAQKYTHQAVFNSNGGIIQGDIVKTCDTNSSQCTINNLPTATREGYIFKGWSTASTCKTGETKNLTIKSKQQTFYACWQAKENKYIAKFNSNGGALVGASELSCTTVSSSCEINNLPSATLEDYTFTGWGEDKTCTIGSLDKLTLSKENSEYYACWIKNSDETNVYTVDFYDGIEKIESKSCTVVEGMALCKIDPPEINPSRENKVFTGWGNNENCQMGEKSNIRIFSNTAKYACYMDEIVEKPQIEPPKNTNNSMIYIIIVLVIIIGLGAGGYWYFKIKKSKENI